MSRNAVPPVLDKYFVSINHLPFYCNIPGIHSWAKQGVGSWNKRDFRSEIRTGREEKEHSTA